jgi:hypothetical protein
VIDVDARPVRAVETTVGKTLRPRTPRTGPQNLLRFAAVGALVVLGVVTAERVLRSDTPVRLDFNTRTRPVEFLYLDNVRVLAFLSQLEDGLSDSERRMSSRTTGINVGVGGGVTGGASDEVASAVEQVVTPTAASRLSRFRNLLADRHWFLRLDASQLGPLQTRHRFYERLGRAAEGGFVEISHVRLTVPPPVTVYRYARRSGAADAAAFVKAVGANPRVPMSLRTEWSPSLLFVGRYSALADEPSLFFGEVTVLGKVIRQLKSAPGVYTDREAIATYGPALASAPPGILKKLQIRRSSLGPSLRADVTVSAPGAVIIPIAIYK